MGLQDSCISQGTFIDGLQTYAYTYDGVSPGHAQQVERDNDTPVPTD